MPDFVESIIQKYSPTSWDRSSDLDDDDCYLVKLSKRNTSYTYVKNKIRQTLSVDIDKIYRVENPFLWGCYQLRKQECVSRHGDAIEEMNLFHCTAQKHIKSITTNNLDWRRSVRTRFGQGVSFSSSAAYADKYCNRNVGYNRALILATVLVGNTCHGDYNTDIPELEECDTTTCYRGFVYVKYHDHEFFPKYVAYY